MYMGCIWDVYGTAFRLVCALPWPQHVSATCNCDHGTMLLAGCSDRRITAWATSSIFSRSPGPFAEWKTLRKPSTSFSLQSTLTCLPVDFARCGTHHVQVFLRYCQHAIQIMPYISHGSLGTSATCRVANKAPHFWTFALGCQQLEFLEDH